MEAFLSFILATVLIVYFVGLIGKWMLRRWISRKQRDFEQRFGNAGGYRQYTWTNGAPRNNSKGKPEGEIKVQRTVPTEKKVSGCVGDYVDYEEVEVKTENKETES